jgi:predicted CopG family antitoxin
MSTTTTIAISYETKEVLRQLGEKDESYEDVIQKLIKEASLKKLDERWNKILKEDKFIPLDEL